MDYHLENKVCQKSKEINLTNSIPEGTQYLPGQYTTNQNNFHLQQKYQEHKLQINYSGGNEKFDHNNNSYRSKIRPKNQNHSHSAPIFHKLATAWHDRLTKVQKCSVFFSNSPKRGAISFIFSFKSLLSMFRSLFIFNFVLCFSFLNIGVINCMFLKSHDVNDMLDQFHFTSAIRVDTSESENHDNFQLNFQNSRLVRGDYHSRKRRSVEENLKFQPNTKYDQEFTHLFNITLPNRNQNQPITLKLTNKNYLLRPDSAIYSHDHTNARFENIPLPSFHRSVYESDDISSQKLLTVPDGTYSGTVINYGNSRVSITNYNGHLAGVIQLDFDDNSGDSEFFIQPLEGSNNFGRHVIYQTKNIKNQNNVKSKACLLGPRSQDLVLRKKRSITPGELDLALDEGSYHRRIFTTNNNNYRSAYRASRSTTYYIEIMVAADNTVIQFHGDRNLQQYIVTLVNIVDDIYKHESLGVDLRIVLIDIVMLSNYRDPLITYKDPQKSLNSICNWAGNHDRNKKYDMTVFLTRHDFGPAGYAPVGGMCQSAQRRSCSLNQEDGFSSAFVIAHEMGHVLGLEHDGENGNICYEAVNFESIMAPVVKSTFRRYEWSRCSKKTLQRLLPTYRCLQDQPTWKDWGMRAKYPGEMYSLDEQCKYDFGETFGVCKMFGNKDPCAQLWCADRRNPQFCKTKKGPPLDGTICARNRQCFKGRCVHSHHTTAKRPVNGGWSNWSSWDRCSRTCDGGLQYRRRTCTAPVPMNGGQDCVGDGLDPRICNSQPCRNHLGKIKLVDYRQQQCTSFDNSILYSGKLHDWYALENTKIKSRTPVEKCELVCRSKDVPAYNMGDPVKDGTRCSYLDDYGICVQGVCQNMGCDMVLGSAKRYDKCGICGGDDRHCMQVVDKSKGTLTTSSRQIRKGYYRCMSETTEDDVVLPKGARGIVMYTTRPSRYTIALKNNSKKGSRAYFLRRFLEIL